MKKSAKILLIYIGFTINAHAMMDEEGDFFPVSSTVSLKAERELLTKEIRELKLQKTQLEQKIENMKKIHSNYENEVKALMAIRRIRLNNQEEEAAMLISKAIIEIDFKNKKER